MPRCSPSGTSSPSSAPIRAAPSASPRGTVGKLGILAGAGELPRRVIDACRAAEREIFVLGFTGETDPAILADVPHAVIRLGAAGEGFRLLREAGVDELVFAGGIRRPTVMSLRPDWRAA